MTVLLFILRALAVWFAVSIVLVALGVAVALVVGMASKPADRPTWPPRDGRGA